MQQAPWSQDAYLKALRFAAQAHQGQKFPGTEFPYMLHLGMVSMEVMAALAVESGRDGTLAVSCALLHDVLEDTPTLPELLEKEFGTAVLQGVRALSKNPDVPKPDRMADSLRRIREQPPEIAMVKLADRITNLQPPPAHWTPEKRGAYREEARHILAALGSASSFLETRLRRKIETYAV